MYSLETELLNIDGHYSWTTRNACEGVMVFGATGSGKSSGPLRHIAMSFLKNNYGGIIFCAKPDEAETWIEYAKEAHRGKDIILLSEETFNFLSYEQEREGPGGGQIENIVNVFFEVVEADKSKKNVGSSNEKYWENAVKQLLRNTITLLQYAAEPLTLQNIKRVIDSAPKDPYEIDDIERYCNKLFQKAIEGGFSIEPEYELVHSYFKEEFPKHDEKTRSNTISSFSVVADAMLRGELLRCFSAEKSSLSLESIYREGKILIVDYNIKEWDKAGKYAAAVVKYCFQKAIERRSDLKETGRPVFLFADECQYFLNHYDQTFQTTARSSRVITVYATQNIGNLQEGYGKERTSSLLGNMGTKIFCQNGDKDTNNWAAESIGKHIVRRNSRNTSDSKSSTTGNSATRSDSTSKGWSEQKDFIIDPYDFTILKKGGPKGLCEVGFVFWQSGVQIVGEQTYIKTVVKQKCKKICGAKKEYKCKQTKKQGKGEKIGKKKIFLVTDFGVLFMVIISALAFMYGIAIIGSEYDSAVVHLLKFILTEADLIIYAAGTIGFYYLSDLTIIVFIIISNSILGKPRKKLKRRMGINSLSIIGLYLFSSILLTFMIRDYFYKGQDFIKFIFIWFIAALICKILKFSDVVHIEKK